MGKEAAVSEIERPSLPSLAVEVSIQPAGRADHDAQPRLAEVHIDPFPPRARIG